MRDTRWAMVHAVDVVCVFNHSQDKYTIARSIDGDPPNTYLFSRRKLLEQHLIPKYASVSYVSILVSFTTSSITSIVPSSP